MDQIRAWKDPAYRAGLSGTQSAALRDLPVATVDLYDPGLGKTPGQKADSSFVCSWVPPHC